MVTGIAYAEVPDVSKWSCPDKNVESFSEYGLEVIDCSVIESSRVYVKVSGELIYIHEHRTDKGEIVYYNALKTNDGAWVEVVNKKDLIWSGKEVENKGVEMSIIDDNGAVVAKRIISLLKK